MSTIKQLREVAEEMENWFLTPPSAKQMARWVNTIREFTEAPRCPMCGTSVAPKQRLWADVTDRRMFQCVACQHKGPAADNEQDALAAFYGEEE